MLLNVSQARLDLLFRALGDRTRRKLIARLAEQPATVSELAEPFAMSLPAISRHLRVLERAGLILRRVEGREHHCSLNPRGLEAAEVWLGQYRHFWEGQLRALARYVERP
jgi:DNA-binding transcriptional ArsR family regulator